MLALDPPDGGATLGGVVATADSGPLRAPLRRRARPRRRDAVALSDGTLAKSGGKVIKNVAGYDLAKLFAGSLGTLGAIVEVSVRLHPLQPASATAIGRAADADELGRALTGRARAARAQRLRRGWTDGGGALLVASPAWRRGRRRSSPSGCCASAGLETEIEEDDEELWAGQRDAPARRAAQRRPIVRVSAPPTRLPALIRATEDAGGSLVGRAALGLSWLRLPEPARRPDRVAAAHPPSLPLRRARPAGVARASTRGAPSTRPCSRSCAG